MSWMITLNGTENVTDGVDDTNRVAEDKNGTKIVVDSTYIVFHSMSRVSLKESCIVLENDVLVPRVAPKIAKLKVLQMAFWALKNILQNFFFY